MRIIRTPIESSLVTAILAIDVPIYILSLLAAKIGLSPFTAQLGKLNSRFYFHKKTPFKSGTGLVGLGLGLIYRLSAGLDKIRLDLLMKPLKQSDQKLIEIMAQMKTDAQHYSKNSQSPHLTRRDKTGIKETGMPKTPCFTKIHAELVKQLIQRHRITSIQFLNKLQLY